MKYTLLNPLTIRPIFYIFTDAATSSSHHISIGGFLYLSEIMLKEFEDCAYHELPHKIAKQVFYKQYHSNKSTWAEIRTVIDAINSVPKNSLELQIIELYTDCQNVCDLISRRREKLEKNNFITKSGKILEHAELYKELFLLTKTYPIHFIKVKGHDVSTNRITIQQKIFDVLDKLTRQKLRSIVL